jgi:cysteine-rich repeat protein
MRVLTESESNDSMSLPDDLGHCSVIVLGSLMAPAPAEPGSDTDVFTFTLTAPRSDVEIRAFSGAPPSTSCDGLHLRFELFQAPDTSTAYLDDFANDTGECTALDWHTEPLMRGLPAGLYYLRVTINGWDPPVPAYYLQLDVASECGDGLVSGSEQCDSSDATRCSPTTCQKIPICGDREILTPENCDDGNTTNGDGCSSTCQREAVSEVELNDTTTDADARATSASIVIRSDAYYTGSITYETDETDVYKVELTSPGVVRFESFESLLGYDCADDARHQIILYDSAGNTLVPNSYTTGIQGYCAGFAIGLDAGTYYAEFSNALGTHDTPAYRLEADFMDDVGTETEPNDTMLEATPLTGSSFVVHGSFLSSADVDYYAITVPVGFSVRAQTLPGTVNGKICDGTLANPITNTVLRLLDGQGIELAYNDDWYDGCSSFDGTGANRSWNFPNAWNYTGTTQTYYLAVSPWPGTSAYRLAVTIRP